VKNNWDVYYRTLCEAVATKSPCLSRQIGAVLVRDKSIVSTGFNGPPRGVPHCNTIIRRNSIMEVLRNENPGLLSEFRSGLSDLTLCPRKAMGFKSGNGLERWCIAAHAERNCLINAARLGVSTLGTSLYMNCIVPCKDCLIELINAGVEEIVVDEVEAYNDTSFIRKHSKIRIRRFNLG